MSQRAGTASDSPHQRVAVAPAPAGGARGRVGSTRRWAAGGILAAVALAAAACGSSPAASPTTTSGAGASSTTGATGTAAATVKTASTSQGTVLVNGSGMALYTYGPDHGGAQSACTGTCIQAWPPLTVPSGTTPTAGAGATGTLGTARQSDGALQVTYNGNLLYTFLSDPSPGQVTGNGVAGFSVAKLAAASSAATTASSAATTSTTSGGYQY